MDSKTGSRPLAAGLILAAALTAAPSLAFRVSKADFPRFAGVLACGGGGETGDWCAGAESGFIRQGLVGEDIQDPTAAELTRGGNIVVGFLEGKPFSWARYSVDY